MKQQWKKTCIWYVLTVCAVMLIMFPMCWIAVCCSGIMLICHLTAAISLTVKRNARPYIPFSITAVVIAAAVTLITAHDLLRYDVRDIIAGKVISAFIFIVPFALGIAALAYLRGRRKEKDQGGNDHGEQ
ncbi:hypothetical protein [uncultured Ruminococcus sp.]|uniref:hypothetical protein n=1 Tax=uncultured Ruminococcus sp. TaxID=165186 RepID=UPI00262D610F|nr:hypothetical protein [uncultured Ruminococcus sp.]